MFIDINDLSLFEEWKAAHEAENAAVNALYSALKNGIRDTKTLEMLTKQMEDTHNNAMDIYGRLKVRGLENG